LAGARHDFLALRDEVQGADGAVDGLTTLQQLGQHLQGLAERQSLHQERQRLREELERVRRISHKRDPSFPSLQVGPGRVGEALDAVERAPNRAELLEVDRQAQPFRDLWAALTDHDNLDETSLELIEQAFGPAVVRALALHRLIVAAEAPAVVEPPP